MTHRLLAGFLVTLSTMKNRVEELVKQRRYPVKPTYIYDVEVDVLDLADWGGRGVLL